MYIYVYIYIYIYGDALRREVAPRVVRKPRQQGGLRDPHCGGAFETTPSHIFMVYMTSYVYMNHICYIQMIYEYIIYVIL